MQIAREIFPDEPDEVLDYLIWNETGFPCFWAPEDGATPEECLRKQLMDVKYENQKTTANSQ